jgi:predicted DNA binding protein
MGGDDGGIRMSTHGSSDGVTVSEADDGEEAGGGIQVEMVVRGPGCCPIADLSGECNALVNSVARSSPAEDCEVAEFTLPAEADPPADDMTPVFRTGSRTRYRYSYDPDGPCLCRFVEQHNCPVSDIHAENGDLFVTFYAESVETVRTIVTEAREVFSAVRLRHLSHSAGLDDEDHVVVDRGRLTDRQTEVLSTAYEMGYFDHPKEANANEVAAELDIATSTFSEHLAAAQGKLLSSVVAE